MFPPPPSSASSTHTYIHTGGVIHTCTTLSIHIRQRIGGAWRGGGDGHGDVSEESRGTHAGVSCRAGSGSDGQTPGAAFLARFEFLSVFRVHSRPLASLHAGCCVHQKYWTASSAPQSSWRQANE